MRAVEEMVYFCTMRIIFTFLLLVCTIANAQTEIKVMNYNVLNYPTGTLDRRDTLKKIVDYYTPDLLMLQELKSSVGLQEAEDVLNEVSNDTYQAGAYVVQQSNPSNSWKLQQNIVFNTSVFGLAAQETVLTAYRDVNYFKLFIKDENLSVSLDTTYLHVFVTHLKSSQGTENEQKRLEMAQTMKTRIDALPANSLVLCGGDFNLYTSSEDAYIHLINPATNNPLEDPIDMPGNWHSSSFSNKEILTQSTRLNSLEDGAGGGLDDRFDFVLHSASLSDGFSDIQYVTNTYKALGNNGTCYNVDLIDCTTTNNVPATMLSALYQMSDHLPVVFSLNTDIVLGTSENESLSFSIYPNPANDFITIKGLPVGNYKAQIFDMSGKVISNTISLKNPQLNVSHLESGIYFLSITSQEGVTSQVKFVK